MTDDLDNLGLAPAANLSVEAVEEVQAATDKLPSPTLITNAMGPEVIVIKRRKVGNCVTDEAAGRVGVHAEQEGDEEVVRVPECLERLLADPVMGSSVDQQHAQQHNVSGDTASFCVVNLKSDLGSHLHTFNVEEATPLSAYHSCLLPLHATHLT